MIWPSLFHLVRDGLLPEAVRIVGVGRKPLDPADFRVQLDASLRSFLPDDVIDAKALHALLERVEYAHAAVTADEQFDAGNLPALLQTCGRVLYFLSVSPTHYGAICRGLGAAGLVNAASRIILEKPIGHDQQSGRAVNAAVAEVFGEQQVFRIDHYLGKETVQNLAALRFGNALFEPLWNKNAIDNVQITVAETVGVEGRWSYYDDAGALRDMVQNHLLQLVALVAMEPPQSLDPDADGAVAHVRLAPRLRRIVVAIDDAVQVPRDDSGDLLEFLKVEGPILHKGRQAQRSQVAHGRLVRPGNLHNLGAQV
jgi:glucose-6-phosphate 1-dehydrogenase